MRSERSFTIENNRFVKDGKPLQIISGSIHYNRIHPAYWRDRLQRVQAMGLNSIQLYVPWNFHERSPGTFKWDGEADIERFLDIAQELGLNVLLRPGPYICGEWDFGGFPWWLASSKVEGGRTMKLRVNDPAYLGHVDRFWNVLLPKMAPYLYHRGGPILMTQIENEYGFCGFNDKAYLQHLVDTARASLGDEAVLFTTDPPNVVTMGGLYGDDVISVVDFGPGTDVNYAFTAQSVMNPFGKSPPFCSEFYTGWLSHWGEVMANTSARFMLQTLSDILSYANGTGSVNFYMAHGGSNFGYWAGANMAGSIYQPHITSYDYDCPVSEAGDIGQPGIGGDNKFKLIRDVIEKQTGVKPPELPPPPVTEDYGAVELVETATLLDQLHELFPGDGIASEQPDVMEEYGQSGGLILYRTTVNATSLTANAVLDIGEPVRDYARVLLDGKIVGFFERSNPRKLPLPSLSTSSGEVTLDILVEALGRVNFGCVWDYKGLVSPDITLNGEVLKGWHIYPLQLDDLSNISYSKGPVSQPDLARFDAEGSALLAAMARFAVLPSRAASGQPAAASGQLRAPSAAEVGPTFYRGTFNVNATEAPKGIDGHLADTFVSGENEIVLLEVEATPSDATVRLTGQADFYGPSYGKKPVQARLSPRPFDRSVYMPGGGATAESSYALPASLALSAA
ncbi:hypothetical protein WJX75_006251 [Coccomyxa subellipsoidea]|uniref:Beta-galactosidase n=1 Tax=Coccomyxa subellipsoidea TaxID=248742 RepID=A0ABR2YWD2_9CHLO